MLVSYLMENITNDVVQHTDFVICSIKLSLSTQRVWYYTGHVETVETQLCKATRNIAHISTAFPSGRNVCVPKQHHSNFSLRSWVRYCKVTHEKVKKSSTVGCKESMKNHEPIPKIGLDMTWQKPYSDANCFSCGRL